MSDTKIKTAEKWGEIFFKKRSSESSQVILTISEQDELLIDIGELKLAEKEKIKTALRNSRAFIDGMMDVGAIPVQLCKLASDIHTQIQEAEESLSQSAGEEWISVKDRLPENTGHNMSNKVIIVSEFGEQYMARYDFEIKDWNVLYTRKITFWRELHKSPTP